MKENMELERSDLAIDPDMQIDSDIGKEIIVYIETWFDVDKKFGISTEADDEWLNMYGSYNPYEDTLWIECEKSSDSNSECFEYTPTEAEAKLIKDMITEKIRELWNLTPKEFCDDIVGRDQTIGGIE